MFLFIIQQKKLYRMEKEYEADDIGSEQSSQQQDNTQKMDEELKLRIEQGLRKKKQLDAKAQQTGISKSQLKKLQKKQKWEEQKMIKRKQKREKQRQRKKQTKQQQQQQQQQQHPNNPNIHPTNQSHPDFEHTRKRKDEYQQKMRDNLKVVIDMQFYDQMVEKQLNSLVKQLSYCHAVNRKMPRPFHYILTSMTGTVWNQRVRFLDEKYNGNKWGIELLQQSLTDAFKCQDMVYLTGDAEEEMQEFDQNKVYVIGGIVDHNRLKSITYDFAKKHNIQVKRLPFNNIKLKTNVHLAVNHVWEWMLRKYNGESWDQSLSKVLPQRKIVKIQ